MEVGNPSMALNAAALERLEEQLQCAVCLDTFTNPRMLQCHHVYCCDCLKPLVEDERGQLVVLCPTCRQPTPVPPNGVTGLPSAFFIHQILEIRNTLRGWEGRQSVRCCSVHEGKELELYCETCEELVCSHCVFRGQDHHAHSYELVASSFEKLKAEISPSLAPVEDHLLSIHKTMQSIDANCGEIFEQRQAVEDSIHSTVQRLHDVLEVRRTELIRQLHCFVEEKLGRLAAQMEQLEITRDQVSSCLEFIRESLKVGSQSEVLEMKGIMLEQVHDLATAFKLDTERPCVSADMNFSAPSDTAVRNYGQVFTLTSPNPSKCYVTGSGLDDVVVGERSSLILHVVDFQGEPCEELIRSLLCELVSELTLASVNGTVQRRGLSHYKVCYQPAVKGRHQLHVRVEGQHIRGSPFTICATLPVKNIGEAILSFDRVSSPWGMAVNHRGELLVTECKKHCVSVFSTTGEKIYSIGHHGSGEGQFSSPNGITVDSEGCVIVADCGNHRIQKFSADGKFLAAVGREGSGPLEFSHPKNVVFNLANNKLYVVDGTDRIAVLNSNLTYHKSFGRFGSGKKKFNNPWGIACDSVGRVYVSDTWNKRVQVFTAEGKFLKTIGNLGEGFARLRGAC